MGQYIYIGLLLVIFSLVWLGIPSTGAQFMLSPLLRRHKEQAVGDFIKEISELDIPYINKNEYSNRKFSDGRTNKQDGYSLQGRMVSETSGKDYSEVDLNCDMDFMDNLQVDSVHGSYSSRIECLNRNRQYSRRHQTAGKQNQNQLSKMQTKLERLIDYLNALRASQRRRSG